MMDRRTFNKGVGAFFGALALPGGLKAVGSVSDWKAGPIDLKWDGKVWSAGSTPVFVANDMKMTTIFELPQVFTTGSLEIYENIEEKPDVDVEVNVSFWLDKDREIERKVYFKGDNKTYSPVLSGGRETCVSPESFKTFEPGTENRVPLNELRSDAFYDIVVFAGGMSEDSSTTQFKNRLVTYEEEQRDYIITLKNFQVNKITTGVQE